MIDQSTNKAILAAVEANWMAQVGFLEAVVETNSFSKNPAGVERVAERVIGELKALGLNHRRFPQSRVADFHRFDTAPDESRSGKSHLVLIGHLDTVFPPDGDFLHFSASPASDPKPESDHGVTQFHGPGVMDMKGGVSVMIFALAALRTAGVPLESLPVSLLFNSDEELGSPRSASWIREQLAGASAALVFEGGREANAIVTGRKGTGRMRVKTVGRMAHAGNHHREGINALTQMAHVCIGLEALTDYDRQLTVNVGVISGGLAKNVVPEVAEALVDFRYIDPADAEWLEKRIRELEATEFLAGARTEIELFVARPPMVRSDASLALVERYARLSPIVGFTSSEAPLQGGGSDANLASAAGVAAIDGLGPYGLGFHTPNEWISVESLRQKTLALALFLMDWTR